MRLRDPRRTTAGGCSRSSTTRPGSSPKTSRPARCRRRGSEDRSTPRAAVQQGGAGHAVDRARLAPDRQVHLREHRHGLSAWPLDGPRRRRGGDDGDGPAVSWRVAAEAHRRPRRRSRWPTAPSTSATSSTTATIERPPPRRPFDDRAGRPHRRPRHRPAARRPPAASGLRTSACTAITRRRTRRCCAWPVSSLDSRFPRTRLDRIAKALDDSGRFRSVDVRKRYASLTRPERHPHRHRRRGAGRYCHRRAGPGADADAQGAHDVDADPAKRGRLRPDLRRARQPGGRAGPADPRVCAPVVGRRASGDRGDRAPLRARSR